MLTLACSLCSTGLKTVLTAPPELYWVFRDFHIRRYHDETFHGLVAEERIQRDSDGAAPRRCTRSWWLTGNTFLWFRQNCNGKVPLISPQCERVREWHHVTSDHIFLLPDERQSRFFPVMSIKKSPTYNLITCLDYSPKGSGDTWSVARGPELISIFHVVIWRNKEIKATWWPFLGC